MIFPSDLRLPSPLQALSLPEAEAHGIELYIKRDDLIHPMVSGNKWRKLEGFLQEALLYHPTSLVSFGGYYSNHLLALAAAGAMLHIKTEGIVRGEAPDKEGAVLRICRLLGMNLQYTSRGAFAEMKRNYAGIDPVNSKYYIPEGGYGVCGLTGIKSIREEIPFIPDHIITATGTGTTLAGLALAYAGERTIMEGIVVLKGMDSLEAEISALIRSSPKSVTRLHHDFHHGGYARISPKLNDFIRSFIASTGILIDPVYAAKMLYATRELIVSGYFKKGAKVVCLHTGGTLGGLSLLEEMNFTPD